MEIKNNKISNKFIHISILLAIVAMEEITGGLIAQILRQKKGRILNSP